MTPITQSHHQDLVSALAQGIIVPTLSPFDEDGRVLMAAVGDQTQRFARIDCVAGIAANTVNREHEALTPVERIDVIRETRAALSAGQLLLAHVGTLEALELENIAACKAAGADAVICRLPRWPEGLERAAPDDRIGKLIDQINQLPIPIIIALDSVELDHPEIGPETIHLVQDCHNLIGVTLGADDNVLHYDQSYYALKSIGRSLICLTAAEGALFHTLNTGADGVMSPLARLAPHEAVALFKASRAGRFHDAQALHNRLAPLIGLLAGNDAETREMISREIAHHRDLLTSPECRGVSSPLSPDLKQHIHQVIDDIGLKPVSWV